jgi:hypothetical protein
MFSKLRSDTFDRSNLSAAYEVLLHFFFLEPRRNYFLSLPMSKKVSWLVRVPGAVAMIRSRQFCSNTVANILNLLAVTKAVAAAYIGRVTVG